MVMWTNWGYEEVDVKQEQPQCKEFGNYMNATLVIDCDFIDMTETWTIAYHGSWLPWEGGRLQLTFALPSWERFICWWATFYLFGYCTAMQTLHSQTSSWLWIRDDPGGYPKLAKPITYCQIRNWCPIRIASHCYVLIFSNQLWLEKLHGNQLITFRFKHLLVVFTITSTLIRKQKSIKFHRKSIPSTSHNSPQGPRSIL